MQTSETYGAASDGRFLQKAASLDLIQFPKIINSCCGVTEICFKSCNSSFSKMSKKSDFSSGSEESDK